MANQVSGLIKAIDKPQTMQSKGGSTYTKQSVYLDCSHYDQYSGQKHENFLFLDFINAKEGDLRQRFLVGQRVDVSFSLRGYTYDGADGKRRWGVSVNCYRIELSASQPQPMYTPQQQPPVVTATAEAADEADLPF